MSDEPDFIVAGEWHDPDPNPVLDPRLHPFGPDAYEETRGGVRRIYRDRNTRNATPEADARASKARG